MMDGTRKIARYRRGVGQASKSTLFQPLGVTTAPSSARLAEMCEFAVRNVQMAGKA
jgi:hypothetical protein